MLRENDVFWDWKMVTLVTNRPVFNAAKNGEMGNGKWEKSGFLTRTHTRNRIFNRHFSGNHGPVHR